MADHKSKALLEALYNLFYSRLGASKAGDLTLSDSRAECALSPPTTPNALHLK